MSNVGDNAFPMENDSRIYAILFKSIDFSTSNDNTLADSYFPLDIKKIQGSMADKESNRQEIEEVDVSNDDSVKDPDFDSGDDETENTIDNEITEGSFKRRKKSRTKPADFSTTNDNTLADSYFPVDIKKNQGSLADSSIKELVERK
ncbi:unnamed protein product [Psylliodes chrysocephalus]|uniref:Uncharacterized protein n=1 Tax=Psylliodes chrysocephalus TaxID=3402493 RepID=A0A9P0D3S7_9CUCU|nr:unnamed protein product [Psylliodes chrysocephala]